MTERITPEGIVLGRNLRGFGYSFSNIGDGEKMNGEPYFAVGAVDINNEGLQKHDDVVLFNSAPLNIRECDDKDCKTLVEITPNVLGKKDRGKNFLIEFKKKSYVIIEYRINLFLIFCIFIHFRRFHCNHHVACVE